jgi:hypothetical protein
MMPRHGIAVTVVALALMAGCRTRKSPEQQVRDVIAGAEAAVEDRDIGRLAGLVSNQYADGEDNDRAAVLALVRLQFIRFPAIHLLVRVTQLGISAPGRGEATVVVAMASLPMAAAADLARVSASLYRFDLVFAEESGGHWRVRSAAWSPGRAEDFL